MGGRVCQVEETPKPEPLAQLRVGLTYNLKKGTQGPTADAEAEYDEIETVLAIRDALQGDNCRVELMEADETLLGRLKSTPVDIVFNIAEGRGGRAREAQVPALLNLLGIPFTGSDETTLCVALDKALAKRILSTYRILTPKYRVLTKGTPRAGHRLRYPVILKPVAEGSSKGISDLCIANDETQLLAMASQNIEAYGQDMLAEEYIGGREFTVGLLGNGDGLRVFRPMEIIYLDEQNPYRIYSYQVKKNYKRLIRYECPARLDGGTEAKIIKTAKKIFEVLQCRDFARVDFRLSDEGRLYFIEINPLPGLAPGYSDYPMLAEFNQMDYVSLVRNVLDAALVRYGLVFCR